MGAGGIAAAGVIVLAHGRRIGLPERGGLIDGRAGWSVRIRYARKGAHGRGGAIRAFFLSVCVEKHVTVKLTPGGWLRQNLTEI